MTQALQAQVTNDKEQAAQQKEINGIREKTQDAAGRYAQAMADADSLERYNKQLDSQVKSQETEMASIERQLTDIETTNREVQPLMSQMVDTLDQFVKLDVPFLLDERTARVRSSSSTAARSTRTKAVSARVRTRPRSNSCGSAAFRSCIEPWTAPRSAIGMPIRRSGLRTRAIAKTSSKPSASLAAKARKSC